MIGDITYYNDGDWVESCTALTEDFEGGMAILDWPAHMRGEAISAKTLEVVA
jgi:hypothetical protein